MPGTPNPWKGYAALALACAALALGIHAELRGAPAPAPGACVDQTARDQVAQLRRALAERAADLARLPPSAPEPGAAPPAEPARSPDPASTDPGPRRYVRFEIPNPAVRVTQKDDGTLDVRSSDPGLAGSILTVTAISESGAEDKVLIRVP